MANDVKLINEAFKDVMIRKRLPEDANASYEGETWSPPKTHNASPVNYKGLVELANTFSQAVDSNQVNFRGTPINLEIVNNVLDHFIGWSVRTKKISPDNV